MEPNLKLDTKCNNRERPFYPHAGPFPTTHAYEPTVELLFGYVAIHLDGSRGWGSPSRMVTSHNLPDILDPAHFIPINCASVTRSPKSSLYDRFESSKPREGLYGRAEISNDYFTELTSHYKNPYKASYISLSGIRIQYPRPVKLVSITIRGNAWGNIHQCIIMSRSGRKMRQLAYRPVSQCADINDYNECEFFFDSPPRDPVALATRVQIHKLGKKSNEEDVRRVFSSCGKIKSVLIDRQAGDEENGRVVIEFEKQEGAKTAVERYGSRPPDGLDLPTVTTGVDLVPRVQPQVVSKVPGLSVSDTFDIIEFPHGFSLLRQFEIQVRPSLLSLVEATTLYIAQNQNKWTKDELETTLPRELWVRLRAVMGN